MIDKLTRDYLDERCVETLRTARGSRPDLKLIDLKGQLVVLKDYRNSDPLFRMLIGPILIRREAGALRQLTAVEGIPKLITLVDRHAILIEHIDGRPLRKVETDSLDAGFFLRLEDLINRMHAAGVAHCDLRTGGNILVGKDDQPYLIDFVSCVLLGRGWNPFIRLVFREFRRADLRAVPLAKKRVCPSLLTPRDEAELARPLPFERPAIFIGKTVRNVVRRVLTRSRQ